MPAAPVSATIIKTGNTYTATTNPDQVQLTRVGNTEAEAFGNLVEGLRGWGFSTIAVHQFGYPMRVVSVLPDTSAVHQKAPRDDTAKRLMQLSSALKSLSQH